MAIEAYAGRRVVVGLCVAAFVCYAVFFVFDLAELRIFACDRGELYPSNVELDVEQRTRTTRCTIAHARAVYPWSSQLLRAGLLALVPALAGAAAGAFGTNPEGRSSGGSIGLAIAGALTAAFALVRVLMRGAGAGWEEMSIYVGLALAVSLASALISRGATGLALAGPALAGLAVALMAW